MYCWSLVVLRWQWAAGVLIFYDNSSRQSRHSSGCRLHGRRWLRQQSWSGDQRWRRRWAGQNGRKAVVAAARHVFQRSSSFSRVNIVSRCSCTLKSAGSIVWSDHTVTSGKTDGVGWMRMRTQCRRGYRRMFKEKTSLYFGQGNSTKTKTKENRGNQKQWIITITNKNMESLDSGPRQK